MADPLLKRPAYESFIRDLCRSPNSIWPFLEPGGWPKNWDAPDHCVLDALRADNPNELLLQLTKFVAGWMKRKYPWIAPRRGRTADHVAIDGDGAIDPSEIAFDAILAAVRGKGMNGKMDRVWNPSKSTLRQFIWGTATSSMYHMANREKLTRAQKRVLEMPERQGGDGIDHGLISNELKDAIEDFGSTHLEFAPAVEFLCNKGPGVAVKVAQKYGITTQQLGKLVFTCKTQLRSHLAHWNG